MNEWIGTSLVRSKSGQKIGERICKGERMEKNSSERTKTSYFEIDFDSVANV